MEVATQATKDMLDTLLKFERFPFTQNDHYYQICREKLLGAASAIIDYEYSHC